MNKSQNIQVFHCVFESKIASEITKIRTLEYAFESLNANVSRQ